MAAERSAPGRGLVHRESAEVHLNAADDEHNAAVDARDLAENPEH